MGHMLGEDPVRKDRCTEPTHVAEARDCTLVRLLVVGEDQAWPVVLVQGASDTTICEGCGEEVNTYLATDTTATSDMRLDECLPCALKVAKAILRV